MMLADVATIPHMALRSAENFGDAPALVAPDGKPVSYVELAGQMHAAARAFIAAGVERGDRVAIWAPNTILWIVAALGLQAAGGVLVPLNTRYRGSEAAHILRASGARLLVTVESFLGVDYPALIADEAIETLDRTILMDKEEGPESWNAFLISGLAVEPAVAAQRLATLGRGDVSDILFTSGTTGKPKGVVTTHGQNLDVYTTYSNELGWCASDRLLGINPFFHSFGYKAGWLCSLLQGSTLYPILTFDPAKIYEALERERITLMLGPPTIFQSLLDIQQTRTGKTLPWLRLAVTGATMVPVSLIRRMREDLGFQRVTTAYGLTETSGVVSMCSPGDTDETIANTSGRPLPSTQVRIVAADGALLPFGTPGEIEVRGPNVMLGYFNDPVATAGTIDAEGWLRTGDIGIMRDDHCIRITGRSKDVYICGGFNVYPAEVEEALGDHPDIAEVAVIGMADERLGEVGHAFVVASAGSGLKGPEGEAIIIAWARKAIANFKVPRAVTFVESLPRNASGKVEKFKLKVDSI